MNLKVQGWDLLRCSASSENTAAVSGPRRKRVRERRFASRSPYRAGQSKTTTMTVTCEAELLPPTTRRQSKAGTVRPTAMRKSRLNPRELILMDFHRTFKEVGTKLPLFPERRFERESPVLIADRVKRNPTVGLVFELDRLTLRRGDIRRK